MAKTVQFRGGTTTQHSTFTGANREITIDTDKHVPVVHDGVTPGGYPLALASGSVKPDTLTTTQAKDAIYKAHSISSTTSEIDSVVSINIKNSEFGYGISDASDYIEALFAKGSINFLDGIYRLDRAITVPNITVNCSVGVVFYFVGDIDGLILSKKTKWYGGEISTNSIRSDDKDLVVLDTDNRDDAFLVFKPYQVKGRTTAPFTGGILRLKTEANASIVNTDIDIQYAAYAKYGFRPITTGGGTDSYVNSNKVNFGFMRFINEPIVFENGASNCEISGNKISGSIQTHTNDTSYLKMNGAGNTIDLFIWDWLETKVNYIDLFYGTSTVASVGNILKINIPSVSKVFKNSGLFSATNLLESTRHLKSREIHNSAFIMPPSGFNTAMGSPFENILLHADKHPEKFTITKTNIAFGTNTFFNHSPDYGKINNTVGSIKVEFNTSKRLATLGFTTGFTYNAADVPTQIKLIKTLDDLSTQEEIIIGSENKAVWMVGACIFKTIINTELLKAIKIEITTNGTAGATICNVFATQSYYMGGALDLDFRTRSDISFDNGIKIKKPDGTYGTLTLDNSNILTVV